MIRPGMRVRLRHDIFAATRIGVVTRVRNDSVRVTWLFSEDYKGRRSKLFSMAAGEAGPYAAGSLVEVP